MQGRCYLESTTVVAAEGRAINVAFCPEIKNV